MVLLAASIILLIIFADHGLVRAIIASISGLGFLGIFFSGFFIVSTFTIVPATLVMAEMTRIYGFWETVLLASVGAIVGDFLIFSFIRRTANQELKPIIDFIAKEKHIRRIFHSPLFGWVTPVVGAAIIASPLPDELGLSLLGVHGMSNKKFLLLVTVLDFLGISLLVSVLRTL
jgi:uncharacterized membrane protein YdjX (TVP38/TMEM64 family)